MTPARKHIATVLFAALVVGGCSRDEPEPSHPWPDLPAGTAFLDWPVTGNAADDPALFADAVRAWDAATVYLTDTIGPHTDIRPLLLQTGTPAGSIAVLQGLDARHQPRLAVIGGSPGGAQSGLALRSRADRPSPPPAGTRQISLVAGRSGERHGTADPVVALALAAPGSTHVTLASTAAPADRRVEAGGRVAVGLLPGTVTAFTTTVTLTRRGARSSQYADDVAFGEAHAEPVECLAPCSGDRIEVRLPAPPSRPLGPGTLVTTRAGLVGRIRAVRGNTGQVQAVTAPGFEIVAATTAGKYSRALADGNSLRLTGSTDDIAVGDMLFAAQTLDEQTGTRAVLPLGHAVAEEHQPNPTATGFAWQARTLPIQPTGRPGQQTPLYVMTTR